MTSLLITAVLLLPVLGGFGAVCLKKTGHSGLSKLAGSVLTLECLLTVLLSLSEGAHLPLFSMTEKLTVALTVDPASRVFMNLSSFGYLAAGIFSFRYMEGEEKEGSFPEWSFYAFFLFSLSALMGMALADSLVSMYFFFEMITLLSMPLVLFERTDASIGAALKYLFYSVAGAFLALGCIFILSGYAPTLDFAAGGILDISRAEGHEKLLLTAAFLGIVGFGAKAGMYPLHGWLPAAHPVAPAPASAVLSGIIAKAGVFAIFRLIFFGFGTSFLAGTWVQNALLCLALLTVFMGSMMAYREKDLKKRLAYSSVSQLSYVLTGLFLMNRTGLTGAFLQIIFHAAAKICLFLCAGSFIFNAKTRNVDGLAGIGRHMPVTLAAFTCASLSLIGIPPFGGFISKWYLAEGALETALPVFRWLAPVILLVSALLTAGYLLPVTVAGFFPGKIFQDPFTKEAYPELEKEGGLKMKLPLLFLAAFTLIGGCMAGSIASFLEGLLK